MSEYRLSIRDKDGEEHRYGFFADYPLEVTEYVLNQMRQKGDFHGHEHLQMQDVDVCELVRGTLGIDAMDIRVQGQGIRNHHVAEEIPEGEL